MNLGFGLFFVHAQICVAENFWHSFQEHEYFIGTNYVNLYDEAESNCPQFNATIASVKNINVLNFLEVALRDATFFHGLYVGARRNQSTNKLQWTDGTDVNYKWWKKGKYNEGDNCTALVQAWPPSWLTTTSCNISAGYICQRQVKVLPKGTTQIIMKETATPSNYEQTETDNTDFESPAITTKVKKTTRTIIATVATTSTCICAESISNFFQTGYSNDRLAIVRTVVVCIIILALLAVILWLSRDRQRSGREPRYETTHGQQLENFYEIPIAGQA